MSDVETWRHWRAGREAELRDPHGDLALVGTHWLDSEPAPIIEGEPVLWSADPEGKYVVLTAKAAHGLVLAGQPVDGTVRLRPDTDDHPDTVFVPEFDIRLVPIERNGSAALRVYDPTSPELKAFEGVEVFDYDPSWALDATFTAYEGKREEKMVNADGAVRGFGLDGKLAFELEDGTHTLEVVLIKGGKLWIVFADPTTERSTPYFRFVETAPPAADGSVTLDFNRAYLPPCAFTELYVCPVPPQGNTLTTPISAGELAVIGR